MLEVERVLHVARRVIRRHVERLEVVVVVLGLGAFEHLEAHAREDRLDPFAQDGQRMPMAEGVAARKRDVDGVGGGGASSALRASRRGAASISLLELVGEAAEQRPLVGRRRATCFISAVTGAALAAEISVANGLEIALRCDRGEHPGELLAKALDDGRDGMIMMRRLIDSVGSASLRQIEAPHQSRDQSGAGRAVPFACSARCANAAGCETARSARILRSSVDAGSLQPVDQLAVGQPILAGGGVDAHDPQPPEVALLAPAADKRVLERRVDRLFGRAIQLALRGVVPLGPRQQLLALRAPDGSAFHSRHVISPRLLVTQS